MTTTSGAGRHLAIVAAPTPGHWTPLQVLARALIARGHRVTFFHLGDAQRLLTGDDIGFAAIGGPLDRPGALDAFTRRLAGATGPVGFLRSLFATAQLTEALLDRLPEVLVRIGADAVIADGPEPAGGLVARHLGLPFVTSFTGLPLLPDPGVPPPFVGWEYREGEDAVRRNAGGYRVTDWLMRPITRVLDRHARRWGLDARAGHGFSPLLQVAQCPAGLDFPRVEAPSSLRYCGPFRPPSGAAERLHDDGRPLVYCSLGSLQGGRRRLFEVMAAACADVGARAVIAHGGGLDEAAVARLPGDPLARAHWDQPAVLPHCAAAVLHGGFNTVLDALAAGVPIVAAPIAFEQPGAAARLAWTGAGEVIPFRRLTVTRLGEALRRLSPPEAPARAAARRLSAEMAMLGGAELAADLISAALATGRTPA